MRQEYLPSNVDEGEFDVRVTAPEGTSLPAINEVALRVEEELRSIPGVRSVLATAGSGFLGGERRQLLHPAHSPRRTHLPLAALAAVAPVAGLPGQFHPTRHPAGDSPPLRNLPDVRIADSQSADLRRRRRQLGHRFCAARAGP